MQRFKSYDRISGGPHLTYLTSANGPKLGLTYTSHRTLGRTVNPLPYTGVAGPLRLEATPQFPLFPVVSQAEWP
jgi:hypothetical protein